MEIHVRYVDNGKFILNNYEEYNFDNENVRTAYISTVVYKKATIKEILDGLKCMMDNKIPLTFRDIDIDKDERRYLSTKIGDQYWYHISEIRVASQAFVKNEDDEEDHCVVIAVHIEEDWI